MGDKGEIRVRLRDLHERRLWLGGGAWSIGVPLSRRSSLGQRVQLAGSHVAELAGCGTSSDERSTPCVERIMRHRDEAINRYRGATCLGPRQFCPGGKIARRSSFIGGASVMHVCMAQPGADMDPATLPPTAQWIYNVQTAAHPSSYP